MSAETPAVAYSPPTGPSRPRLSSESGATLVELLSTALVVMTVALGTLAALDATNGAAADQRDRAAAQTVAESDQSRLRTLPIETLVALDEVREHKQGETTYSIHSTGGYVDDETRTSSCVEAAPVGGYVEITTTVDWPANTRPPVSLTSIVAPPSGSLHSDNGSIVISVVDQAGAPISGVRIALSGAVRLVATTGDNGCVIFRNIPDGDYTVTPSAAGYVDAEGNEPQPFVATATRGSTNTVVLSYAQHASVDVTFSAYFHGTIVPTRGDVVTVFNTGMEAPVVYGDLAAPLDSVPVEGLFPFESPYSLYSGTCAENNPNPDNKENPPPWVASLVAESGGSHTVNIQLPAIDVRVFTGEDADAPGVAAAGATVKIFDKKCETTRIRTIGSEGRLADIGFPKSDYEFCVELGGKHERFSHKLDKLDETKAETIYLTKGDDGPCPA